MRTPSTHHWHNAYPLSILPGMEMPSEIRNQFRRYGRAGGRARAARMDPDARRAVARRAALEEAASEIEHSDPLTTDADWDCTEDIVGKVQARFVAAIRKLKEKPGG